jgi:dCMP deaminase
MNALLWAARNWVKIEWATIYCTHQPCYECTKNIIASGIKKIVYKEKFIQENWCEIIQIK